MIPRLQQKYSEEILLNVKDQFSLKNDFEVPHLEKIVVNMGLGKAIQDMKLLESAVKDMTTITGQKPVVTRAKIAVSNFKLRKGMPIGCKVTLRRTKMYEFLDRLVNVSLPRIKDFNGVSNKSFDRQGNYSIGITDQSIFPEIDPGRITYSQGMDITFVFNKGPKEYTQAVLLALGIPFSKR
ncbi:MAG: 50S ribosomal protein L5 [Candidatus Omnitrophica bacterium]|nr:50S ribosomal protein L5 [Candidatus Omnitrophota bacterium]